MNKLIIVEGVDGTGKTRLAKWLARRTGAAYAHSRHFGQDYEAYSLNLLQNVQSTWEASQVPTVMDRGWPSEECYGEVLRPAQPRAYMGEPYRLAKELGALYVYCESPGAYSRNIVSPEPLCAADFGPVQDRYQELFHRLARAGERVTRYCIEEHGEDLEVFFKAWL